MTDTMERLTKSVEWLNDRLQMLSNGMEYCPNCDKFYDWDEECECDGKDRWDLYTYVNYEALDIDFLMDMDGEMKGVKAYFTVGGPTIWLDTFNKVIVGSWGTERIEKGVDDDVCEKVNEAFEEIFKDACQRALKSYKME